MNAAGWFVVGMMLGGAMGTFVVALMVSARRADDLAAEQLAEPSNLRVLGGGEPS